MPAPVNAEMIGGIPLVSVIGTPRTMGEHIGERMKSRLQVLSQYLYEQLGSLAESARQGTPLSVEDQRRNLRDNATPTTTLEPALWMELAAMAGAADLPPEDLLQVHGFPDLLSRHRCRVPPSRSTFIALGPDHCDHRHTRLILAWHLDPTFLPYVTLIRRIPAHGPASVSLTLAGLHPVAGLSEAGIAVAANDLRVEDGTNGHFTTHLLAATLTAPSLEDAVHRVTCGSRQGGRCIHLMTGQGQRVSVELSGSQSCVLNDPLPGSPRVHTNHALAEPIRAVLSVPHDDLSRQRLSHFASLAVAARDATPSEIASWFGLGEPAGSHRIQGAYACGATPDHTVLFIADPHSRQVHLHRGGTSCSLETITL